MTDINSPIPYKWTLGWGEEVGGHPVVNALLKSVLEENITEMDYLFSRGATVQAMDETTLCRTLYHLIGNYSIMEWLLRHGLPIRGYPYQCISPSGHLSGFIGAAYDRNAFRVMDLLAAYGNNDFAVYDELFQDAWYADRRILKTGDPRGLKVLLENGYVFSDFPLDRKYYAEYVLGRPQVIRKSVGLDRRTRIPEPRYESVPLIFGRSEAKARNERRREDYEDCLRAHRESGRMSGVKR